MDWSIGPRRCRGRLWFPLLATDTRSGAPPVASGFGIKINIKINTKVNGRDKSVRSTRALEVKVG